MGLDPVTLGAIISAGGSLGGSLLSSNAQKAGLQSAADATRYGADQQAQLAKDTYNLDAQNQFANSRYLSGLLPQFNFNTPDPNQYFGTSGINNYYDQGLKNLYGAQNMATSQTGQQAGALAASRGLSNPSGFITQQTSQARQSFLPQFGALEQSRAGALQQNNGNLYQALLGNSQYLNQLRQMGYGNQLGLVSQFGNPNTAPKTFGG